MRKKLFILTLSAIVLSFSGCGGGGTTETTETTTGTVIDGYLKDAKVCIDKNDNGVCDPEEPYTYTDENGKYVLNEATDSYAVIAEIEAGKTSDVTYNITFTQNAALASLPGNGQVVSPYTSLAYGLYKKLGIDPDEAKNKVKELFGIDPEEDYIASGNVTAALKAFVLTKALSSGSMEDVALAFTLNSTLLENLNSTINNLGVSDITDIGNLITNNTIENLATEIKTCAEETARKEAEYEVDEIRDYENNIDLNNLQNLINIGSVDVITPGNLYRDCSITGESTASGIDMTISCSSGPTIDSTSAPIYSTENMFIAQVENATDSSLINEYIVVMKEYNGTLAYLPDELNGSYTNIKYDNEWTSGSTTYTFTPDSTNSSNGTLQIVSSTSMTFNYHRDENGTIVAENGTNTVYMYPLLKDLNKDFIIYIYGENLNLKEPQILIKQ